MDILKKYEEQLQDTGVGAQGNKTEHFSSDASGMVGLVMKYSGGHVKNEKQATYVLIAFVAAAITTSLFLLFGGSNNNALPPKIMDNTFNQGQIPNDVRLTPPSRMMDNNSNQSSGDVHLTPPSGASR